MSKLTLTEIGKRIRYHLKNLEDDREWNARDPKYGTVHLWNSNAYRAGRYVNVTYISYQGTTSLPRDKAEAYLEGLDGGFKGRHFEYLRRERP